MSAVRFLIRGKVQGVWFRASTREQARALGVRGHARNLDDGRVEVLAVGKDAAVESLAQWLRRGPPEARVDAVDREPAREDEAGEGFEIG